MTKFVVSPSQVAHLWAHRAQDRARNAGDSFYFSGDTIYSYGSHFAIATHLTDTAGDALSGLIVWNDATYGNTTSRHQSHACRALTNQQSRNLLHVPAMDELAARDIYSALSEKRLPTICTALINQVRDLVASLNGKKHGSYPFTRATSKARDYEKTAIAFYTRAGKKYPLPLIPADADIPADKQARASFVLTYARVLLETEYQGHIEKAKNWLKLSELAHADPLQTGHTWQDARTACRVVNSTYDTAQKCEREAHNAQKIYAQLHDGKKSPVVSRILKTIKPIVAEFEARKLKAEEIEVTRELVRIAAYYASQRRKTNPESARNMARNLKENMTAAGVYLPGSWVINVLQKLSRAAQFEELKGTAATLHRAIRDAGSYYAQEYFSDARQTYTSIVRRFETVERQVNNAKTFAYLMGDVCELIPAIRTRLETLDADILKANAEKIRAWCAGESNTKPAYEAGTFARIKGDIIETTHGASVPVAHGCRLARLYAVAVRRGGQAWADGDGPLVGHFRVNYIGADGALTVGCHEFDAVEAKRLHALLETCPACAEVTA